jgi:hypothetical protein
MQNKEIIMKKIAADRNYRMFKQALRPSPPPYDEDWDEGEFDAWATRNPTDRASFTEDEIWASARDMSWNRHQAPFENYLDDRDKFFALAKEWALENGFLWTSDDWDN